MTGVRFPPEGAIDCHAHVVGPRRQYEMVNPRAYTPMDATVDDLVAMLDRLGLARIVLIQTSVFGTDNACMMDALDRLEDRGRGVVQLAAGTQAGEIDALHERGARGIRVNLNTTGLNDPGLARERLREAAELCAPHGWHVQLFTTPAVIEALEPVLFDLPVPLVLDHFGLLSPAGGTEAAERIVLDLLERERAFVKVSGTYRLDPAGDAAATAALARRLAAANVDRLVWGSDWPHSPHHAGAAEIDPPEAPYRELDTKALLTTVAEWFPDEETRRKILVETPARLYGWSDGGT